MNKPVTITTPSHALAVAIYVFQSALGVTHILDLAEAKSMNQYAGPAVTDLWALCLVLSGAVATLAVLIAHSTPVRALRTEFWAAISIGILNTGYETSLIIGIGPGEALTTQMFTTSIAIGCFARAVQAHRDRKRALRATHNQTVAVVAGEREEG